MSTIIHDTTPRIWFNKKWESTEFRVSLGFPASAYSSILVTLGFRAARRKQSWHVCIRRVVSRLLGCRACFSTSHRQGLWGTTQPVPIWRVVCSPITLSYVQIRWWWHCMKILKIQKICLHSEAGRVCTVWGLHRRLASKSLARPVGTAVFMTPKEWGCGGDGGVGFLGFSGSLTLLKQGWREQAVVWREE